MNGLQKKILKFVSKMAEREAQISTDTKKAPCIGFFYQPKRPKVKG